VGFDLSRRRIRLVFDDPAFAGLEVRVRSAGVDELAAAYAVARDTATPADAIALADTFAGVLIDWNVEQDGKPVPPTREGVGCLDYGDLLRIFAAWLNAAQGLIPTPAADPMVDETDLPMTVA
jgi:hypothetical protein